MRVLLVKTSSMGDVIHTLPALTDASQILPDIEFDWVVEEAFAEIPAWHPRVKNIIPVALRRWRKKPWQALKSSEIADFYRHLRQHRYSHVIDAQGLIKSAVITRISLGKRYGLNWQSAWEPLASLAYQQGIAISPQQHAVTRMRQLMASALNYPIPATLADYGIASNRLPATSYHTAPYVIFLHATTWLTKHWPVEYWQALCQIVVQAGYQVLLPWGNEREQQQARLIAGEHQQAIVLPKLKLADIASVLAKAQAVVTVDTGLGHLAAALAIPTISLYGPTDPKLTGTMGVKQFHLAADFACAPCLQAQCSYKGVSSTFPACFAAMTPARVWSQLQIILKQEI